MSAEFTPRLASADVLARLEVEARARELELAAYQLVAVARAVECGDGDQDVLAARRHDLRLAAVRYAAGPRTAG